MPSFGQSFIAGTGSIVDLAAALVIAYYALWAILGILQKKGSDTARLRIAQGVLIALGFSLAGTLLRTIALQTWRGIRAFVFIYVLRLFLKRVFTGEEKAILKRTA